MKDTGVGDGNQKNQGSQSSFGSTTGINVNMILTQSGVNVRTNPTQELVKYDNYKSRSYIKYDGNTNRTSIF